MNTRLNETGESESQQPAFGGYVAHLLQSMGWMLRGHAQEVTAGEEPKNEPSNSASQADGNKEATSAQLEQLKRQREELRSEGVNDKQLWNEEQRAFLADNDIAVVAPDAASAQMHQEQTGATLLTTLEVPPQYSVRLKTLTADDTLEEQTLAQGKEDAVGFQEVDTATGDITTKEPRPTRLGFDSDTISVRVTEVNKGYLTVENLSTDDTYEVLTLIDSRLVPRRASGYSF